jgi:hypothetical protein
MSVAEDLVAALYPWTEQSPDLADLATAIGSMWNHVELYSADQSDGTPGWCILFDPATCPTEALPFLAQLVGEKLKAGLDDADSRAWINDKPNSRRGSPFAIGSAAQRTLTGAKTVMLYESTLPSGGADAMNDNLVVYTLANETPNQNQVFQDLLTVVPADMVVTLVVLAGATWGSVDSSYGTWAAVKAANATWANVLAPVVGGTAWDS